MIAVSSEIRELINGGAIDVAEARAILRLPPKDTDPLGFDVQLKASRSFHDVRQYQTQQLARVIYLSAALLATVGIVLVSKPMRRRRSPS
ncbi:MAG: hypothetical protein AAGI53_14510 [Planctomycetota bacterium]